MAGKECTIPLGDKLLSKLQCTYLPSQAHEGVQDIIKNSIKYPFHLLVFSPFQWKGFILSSYRDPYL